MTSSRHRRGRASHRSAESSLSSSSSSESEFLHAHHLRVQSLLFQEIALLFRGELSDPLLEDVTVTTLELSPDGRNARIGYTLPALATSTGSSPVDAALQRASGFIRAQLAQGLGLKRVPHLRFVQVGTSEPTEDVPPEEGGEA